MKKTSKTTFQPLLGAKANTDWQTLVPVSRPLVPVSVAMVLADRGEDYVLAAIETGALPFAWDIRGAAAAAREIRIWRSGLLAWLANPLAALAGQAKLPDDQTVLESLFPHRRPELRGTDLQRIFTCSSTHILNLINDGLLRSTTKSGPGPNGSPRITRASVLTFLRNRRVL